MSGQEVMAHLIDRHQRQEEAAMQGFRAPAVTLVESVALAMADAEGNAEAAVRGLSSNYDALGYRTLAKAAIAELRRVGVLPQAEVGP